MIRTFVPGSWVNVISTPLCFPLCFSGTYVVLHIWWVDLHEFMAQANESPLSVSQVSCSVVSNSLWPHGLQHAGLPCPTLTPGAYSNSCPSSWWCHPTISSSVIPFACLQSFLVSGSFPRSQFFKSGDQSIGVSSSASVLPMNIQDRFPLGWTGLISLLSKGLSRVFSNTTVVKHEFLLAQLYL